jgi:methylated-DNA-[protein]-cysteine S-methyltransferase
MSTRFFDTPLGIASVAWNARGLASVHIAKCPQHPALDLNVPTPPPIAMLIARLGEHLAGRKQDFTDIVLDWSLATPFQQKVYHAAQKIPPGYTTTYGEIARQLGLGAEGARAVGNALGANPWLIVVPCHRVVAADGKLTGFSGGNGIETKARLLAIEGAELFSS